MSIDNHWFHCELHDVSFPQGAICPKCGVDFKEREKAALGVHWKDEVRLEDTLYFLQHEHIYCRDEEYEFYSYDGLNINQKEMLRILVLEKRAEFLQLFLKIKNNEN